MVILGAGYTVHIPEVRRIEFDRELSLLRDGTTPPRPLLPKPLNETMLHPVPFDKIGRAHV